MAKNVTPIIRLAELGKTSGGFIHDLVNHMTAATLSMNYMEQKLTKDSEVLRGYAEQSAKTRKSIEQFAKSARAYMKRGKIRSRLGVKKEILAAVEPFRFEAERLKIKIIVRVKNVTKNRAQNEKNLFIWGNRLKFSQIISNLISNAIYACSETRQKSRGNQIKILCTECVVRRQKFVKITVSDSGCGIPKEICGKIFEPFFTTKNRHGAGLGLATIKKIIEEDFGGTITVRGSKFGAKFTVLLRS